MTDKIFNLTWDEDAGVATCSINFKNKQFCGSAKCHEDDNMVKNQITGTYIAEQRAILKVLKHVRDNEIYPAYMALRQLYYSMNKSKSFNKDSYEAKMLFRQLNRYENDLFFIRQEIRLTQAELTAYIQEREKLGKGE
jgi:hypothetical protein